MNECDPNNDKKVWMINLIELSVNFDLELERDLNEHYIYLFTLFLIIFIRIIAFFTICSFFFFICLSLIKFMKHGSEVIYSDFRFAVKAFKSKLSKREHNGRKNG